MIHKVQIDVFLRIAEQHPILDVRSVAEYEHAHIPSAYNLPLFSNDERKIVGTIYKQQGRKDAIKKGLEFFGVKMREMVEEVEAIVKEYNIKNRVVLSEGNNSILIYCWRGGMRSAGVAWLLDLYGFKVYTLSGGYKSFRNWALEKFDVPYLLRIIGGYSGSGKTDLLKELGKANHVVIDLEAIACHKGSAFGGIGEIQQPTQEMFENKLAIALYQIPATLQNEPIWIEDESRRIGSVNLPCVFWKTLQSSPLYFLNIPFEKRLDYIVEIYGKFKKEELQNAIIRIQKRLGGLNAKNAVSYLSADNYKECFRILLNYYDKYYNKGLMERRLLNISISTIAAEHIDVKVNSKLITEYKIIS